MACRLDEVERQNRLEMRESQHNAEAVALSALGLAAPTGDGVRVDATVPGSPAQDVFKKDDQILTVDGVRTLTTCQVGAEIDKHEPGERIFFTIERERETEDGVGRGCPQPERPRGTVHRDRDARRQLSSSTPGSRSSSGPAGSRGRRPG